MAAKTAMHNGLQRIRVLSAVCGVACLGACSGDTAGVAAPPDPNALWSLRFQWHAVNLALTSPYDTAQLTATPRRADGQVLTDVGPVQYTSPDSQVVVSSTGFVTAHSLTSGAHVVARITVNGVTLVDTALVQVTSTALPAPLQTLSIHPPQPFGLQVAHVTEDNLNGWLPFFATVAGGNPVTDSICTALNGCSVPLLVYYASSDTAVAAIDQYGDVIPIGVGRVVFMISTLAYGVGKVDSLPFSVGYKGVQNLNGSSLRSSNRTLSGLQFTDSLTHPATLNMSIGGRGNLRNGTGQPVEVSVSGPANGWLLRGVSRTVDTIPANITINGVTFVSVEFDSVGVYTVRYRLLNRTASLSETYTAHDYP